MELTTFSDTPSENHDLETPQQEQPQTLDELLWEHDVAEEYDAWLQELREARTGWHAREESFEIER